MTKSYAPRMHSAEHILNQAMVRKFDCGRCFNAHVNKKKSKCDYDSCPCIGEHVDNTAEIGEFHMISQDFNDGVLRIRYKLDNTK